MTRFLLILVMIALFLRAVWRLVVGIVDGAASTGRGRSARGVPMVRDPVCGTFVVRSRALAAQFGDRTEYFCSEECRRKYSGR
ncbi:MAG: transcriptional regulator [Acidobacteria bacterium]|nr:transcriptional regulator [Acidobacteriota bacterium]